MAINLDAIRNRLNNLKNANSRSNIWKPEPGEHQIRIVPYIHNRENPFIELLFHYNLIKKSVVSPQSFGNPDPSVELMGRKLEPKMRTYVPVIVRGHETDGIKFWGFGKQIYQELLSFIADPDYGDITDLKTGRDLVVTVKSAEEARKSYAETTIRIKPMQTPATENSDFIEKIKQQPSITELYPEPTYQELKSYLQSWLDESGTYSEEVDYKKPAETTTQSVTKTEVETAFDDLFN